MSRKVFWLFLGVRSQSPGGDSEMPHLRPLRSAVQAGKCNRLPGPACSGNTSGCTHCDWTAGLPQGRRQDAVTRGVGSTSFPLVLSVERRACGRLSAATSRERELPPKALVVSRVRAVECCQECMAPHTTNLIAAQRGFRRAVFWRGTDFCPGRIPGRLAADGREWSSTGLDMRIVLPHRVVKAPSCDRACGNCRS